MDDLIKRQDAIGKIKDWMKFIGYSHSERNVMECTIQMLEELPSAESVIIRCKDCKYFYYDYPYIIQGVPILAHLVCTKWGEGCRASEDGFCYMAERRADE